MATTYRVQIVQGGGLLKLASVEVQFSVARKLAEWYFAMGVPVIVEEVKVVLALDPGAPKNENGAFTEGRTGKLRKFL